MILNQDIFKYLMGDYVELYSLSQDIDKLVYVAPHSVIVKSRVFIENLTKEIARLEKRYDFNSLTLAERLRELKFEDIIDTEIDNLFREIRLIGNQAAHEEVEAELLNAIKVHKNIFKVTCWFIENYIDYKFNTPIYKTPLPQNNNEKINEDELLDKLMNKVEDMIKTNNTTSEQSEDKLTQNITITEQQNKIYENKKECLIHELAKLKESSKEAVEGLNTFSEFKRYLHIERHVQKELEEIILKSNQSSTGKLILVCGSVGDGKSHIISYFKHTYPDILTNFYLHNDATESLEPDKTSMDTLNEVLDNFSDQNLDNASQKLMLAINLGTLNNFIDSVYGERFNKLKEFVLDKKILEAGIEDNNYTDDSMFQFVDFTDYHLYTLKDGKVKSDYIKSLFNKITDKNEYNIFYSSYKNNCVNCKNNNSCPVKKNYEFFSEPQVQEMIVQLLVQAIIKNKLLISTRALLNFLYDMLISRTYIDVNSPTLKQKISSMNELDYIRSLTPNILFNHKDLSHIFEVLYRLDPMNFRSSELDDFVVDFNNSTSIKHYFDENLNLPKGYLSGIEDYTFTSTDRNTLRFELMKTFIRSFYFCNKTNVFLLQDPIYNSYINDLYFWNKGDKNKLKPLYIKIKDAIMKWNGVADKNYLNIFIGKNQSKYKVSEELELKADISNLIENKDIELTKFLNDITLWYKTEKSIQSFDIQLDFQLYELLQNVVNGYRPNKIDKKHYIKYIEFMNKLEAIGSQNERLVFSEKNKEINKKYKLEYSDEFNEYRFVEM